MVAIPTDLDAAKRPRKWLFCPNGYPATGIMTRGWQNQDLAVDKDGALESDGHGDFPDMEIYEGVNGAEFVLDGSGHEFLATHCRVLEVPEEFRQHDYEGEPPIEAWPDDIVALCSRASCLQDVAKHIVMLRRQMPREFEDDTLKTVIDKFLVGRVEAEWESIELRIAVFRKGRKEPERLEEEDEDELLDKADQKHAAQMEDLSDE